MRSGGSRLAGRLGQWVFGGMCLAVFAAAVATPLDLRSQALFAAAIFALALLLNHRRGHRVTLALALISMLVSFRYLFWRIGTSLLAADWTIDVVLGGLLLAAELYAFAMLLLGYLQSLSTLERKPVPLPEDVRSWPTVDILVPTYNEPIEVVRATLLAAQAIDWPADKLTVHLLDDGRRPAFRAFAASAGINYIVRPDNSHAKAGNLNHALSKTRGEYIAIFDCDHVPTRAFLQLTVGWFLRDPKLALVQTPHHFYSPDPFERNLGIFRRKPNEGELFYRLLQPANDLWNAAFFCGSCAVVRRTALVQVGGVAVETVTEDAHTALKMQRAGWNTAYLGIPLAAGLATESLSAHIGQRIRWARGMVQIFRIDNPLLGRGLSFPQRLCYAASMLYYLGGVPRLIFLLAPLSYLLFERHIFGALPLMALAYGLPHLLHLMLTTSRIQGGVRHSFWSEIYETCLSCYIALPTTVALISPRHGKFNVTAKGGVVEEAYFEKRIARPYLLLLGLNLAGVASGVLKLWRGTPEAGVVCINLAWAAQNILILAATVAVAWESQQRRVAPRVAVKLPAMVRLPTGSTLRATTVDLALGGASLTVPTGRELIAGQHLWVSIFQAGEEYPLPATVVALDGRTLRVQFTTLSVEEERALTRAIFSRADAWVRWDEERARDRPLLSLLEVVGQAARGAVRATRALWPSASAPAKPEVAGEAP